MPTSDRDMEPTVIKGKICDRDNICDCLCVGELDPCTLVIFGASGDLTARKLIPALYRMFLSATLPEPATTMPPSAPSCRQPAPAMQGWT